MTIFATRDKDNKVIQRNEVEWHSSNDPTIIIESDETYTVNDRTSYYSLKSLLESLGSPAVNLDFRYAQKSVTMTADGRSVLSTLIDAISHLDEGVGILLTPVNTPAQANSDITERRLASLRAILENRSSVNVKVKPSKLFQQKSLKSNMTNYWRVQIQIER